MHKSFYGLLLLVAMIVVACGSKPKSYDEVGASGLTTRTENLKANLRPQAEKGTMVGQMYAGIEGVGWQTDSAGRSDMRSISDDDAACGAYELSGIERGQKQNVDGVSFEAIRSDILRLFKRGGLVVLSWTMPNYDADDARLDEWTERVATFLSSLQDGYGIKAPVVLMVCPQDGHSWYTRLAPEAYRSMVERVADGLKSNGANNVVIGSLWSSVADARRVEASLPAGIDVLALSLYGRAASASTYGEALNSELTRLETLAQARGVATGLFTGMEGLPTDDYFSAMLLPALRAHKLSFVVLGANRGDPREAHYHVPYPGIDNKKIADFLKFYNDPATIFLGNLNGLYLKKNQ